jgi:hypothetical protein
MENDNHVVVSHKLCCFKGHGQARCRDEVASCGRVKRPVFFITKFLSSVSKFQSNSQSLRRDKFTVTDPFHVKKTVSTLFIELQTCRILFDMNTSLSSVPDTLHAQKLERHEISTNLFRKHSHDVIK